jgi:hypothetical protein
MYPIYFVSGMMGCIPSYHRAFAVKRLSLFPRDGAVADVTAHEHAGP